MYTTIIHPLRKALKLSMNEYAVLDSIVKLSCNTEFSGWCIKSRDKLGEDLDLSKKTVIRIYALLESKDYIVKNSLGHARAKQYLIDIFIGNNIEIKKATENEILNILKRFITPSETVCPPSETVCPQDGDSLSPNINIYNNNYTNNNIRSDEKEFSSPEYEILEEDSEEKKEEETFFDVPTKPQEEKQRKNSAKKKEPTLTHKMRQAFESYYEAEKEEKYYYTAKDGANLSQISKKIKHSIRQRHGTNYAPSDSEMIESWNFILAKLKSNHNWVYSNLNIPNINSQYNQIIANIKSGSNGQTRNGKGATNEEVAEILRKHNIIE